MDDPMPPPSPRESGAGSPEAESTGSDRGDETVAEPRLKKARRGGRAPHPLPNQRKASGGRTERIGGLLRTEGGRPNGEAPRGDVE